MPYVERTDEEIIAAWERWMSRHPDPDKFVFSVGITQYSPRRFVEALKAKDEFLMKVFVEGARRAAKEYNHDPVKSIDRERKPEEANEPHEEGGESG